MWFSSTPPREAQLIFCLKLYRHTYISFNSFRNSLSSEKQRGFDNCTGFIYVDCWAKVKPSVPIVSPCWKSLFLERINLGFFTKGLTAYLLLVRNILTIKQIRLLNSKATDLDWHYSRNYQKPPKPPGEIRTTRKFSQNRVIAAKHVTWRWQVESVAVHCTVLPFSVCFKISLIKFSGSIVYLVFSSSKYTFILISY